MTEEAFPIALAAFFTFGCITIHEARQHARAMTPPLAIITICLGLFVALVGMAEKPEPGNQPMTKGQMMRK